MTNTMEITGLDGCVTDESMVCYKLWLSITKSYKQTLHRKCTREKDKKQKEEEVC